jgi:hypothetical protein
MSLLDVPTLKHSRGHSMPSPGIMADVLPPADGACAGPLRSSLESMGSLLGSDGKGMQRPGQRGAVAERGGSGAMRRSLSMPGRSAARMSQQPLIESLQHWDPIAAQRGQLAGLSPRESKSFRGALSGQEASLQAVFSGAAGGRGEPKELTPVSEGREAAEGQEGSEVLTDGSDDGWGASDRTHRETATRRSYWRGGVGIKAHQDGTPLLASATRYSSSHSDLTQEHRLWRSPIFQERRTVRDHAASVGRSAAAASSFDFLQYLSGGSGRLEAPTPRLPGQLGCGVPHLIARTPTVATSHSPVKTACTPRRMTPPVLSHFPGTLWEDSGRLRCQQRDIHIALAGSVCEGNKQREHALSVSECSSMHMGMSDRDSGAANSECGPPGTGAASDPLGGSNSIGSSASDAAMRSYAACMARMEASGTRPPTRSLAAVPIVDGSPTCWGCTASSYRNVCPALLFHCHHHRLVPPCLATYLRTCLPLFDGVHALACRTQQTRHPTSHPVPSLGCCTQGLGLTSTTPPPPNGTESLPSHRPTGVASPSTPPPQLFQPAPVPQTPCIRPPVNQPLRVQHTGTSPLIVTRCAPRRTVAL